MRTIASLGLAGLYVVGSIGFAQAAARIADGGAAQIAAPFPGEREFVACARPVNGKPRIETGSTRPEILDLIAWLSNMSCRRIVISAAASLDGRRVAFQSHPRTPTEAYRFFYAALQALDLGLTVMASGDALQIVRSHSEQLAHDPRGRRPPARPRSLACGMPSPRRSSP